MNEYTVSFKDLRTESIAKAGGKGAQLGELLSKGFPVPDGFVVTTSAFDYLTNKNLTKEGKSLDSTIYNLIDKLDPNDTEKVNEISGKVKDWIMNAEIPTEIEKSIVDLHKILDSEYVAVRSSATAEDAASASWAGELESYTNVKKDGLINAVKKCWASLYTPRALVYRIEKDLQHQEISVAVVIQKMVQSEVSGVVFTVHPVTKDKNSMVIEAGFGLGESVVAGKITPDMYVIKKGDVSIDSTTLSSQEKMLKLEKGIQSEIEVPADMKETQKLSNEMIGNLAQLALDIEQHYDAPQDIEFALEKGKLFIVQTRPITTL